MADLYNGWWTSNNNGYLNQTHENENVRKVYDYFRNLGWTKQAIAGMCGNFHWESRCDPLKWLNGNVQNVYTSNAAFGIAQWHPPRKLAEWADENGLDYKDGYTQLARIKWEYDNNKQWSMNNLGKHTWSQFAHSTESPSTLARVFFWAYERASGADLPKRQEFADYFYELFLYWDPDPSPTPTPTPEPDDPGDSGDNEQQTTGFDSLYMIYGIMNNKRKKVKVYVL